MRKIAIEKQQSINQMDQIHFGFSNKVKLKLKTKQNSGQIVTNLRLVKIFGFDSTYKKKLIKLDLR